MVTVQTHARIQAVLPHVVTKARSGALVLGPRLLRSYPLRFTPERKRGRRGNMGQYSRMTGGRVKSNHECGTASVST